VEFIAGQCSAKAGRSLLEHDAAYGCPPTPVGGLRISPLVKCMKLSNDEIKTKERGRQFTVAMAFAVGLHLHMHVIDLIEMQAFAVGLHLHMHVIEMQNVKANSN